MDEIDAAQANDEFFRQKALREHFRRRTDTELVKNAEAGPAPGRGAEPGGGAHDGGLLFEGVCEDCGGEIGDARLAAYPAAVRCIGCQTTHERGTRR
jgi:hypothetical protein